jgi:hypothetical membrane protein
MRPTSIRRLAWFAIAAQFLFIAAWIVAGAIDPGYSHLQEGVSALAGEDAAHPWIVTAGIAILGLSFWAVAICLLRVLPRRPAATVAATLFGICGLGSILTAAFPVECSIGGAQVCTDAFKAGDLSWQTYAHVWAADGVQLALLFTPFAIARALWPSRVSPLLVLGGLIGGFIGIGLFFWGFFDAAPGGLDQRIGLLVVHQWIGLIALGVLDATPRDEPPPKPTSMPPRDFFASAWTAQGELTLLPRFIWGRFSQRFDLTREITWISDDAWIVDDRAVLAAGGVETRRLVCRFVESDRILVTAAELPDGAEVTLSEEGYRIWPFRVLVPIGPIGFILSARDEHRLDPDGTLVDTMRLRFVGVPIATLAIRARVSEPRDPRPEAA